MLRIGELLASPVFQKIEISELCISLTTIRPFEHHFRGYEGKCEIKYTTANEALEQLFTKQ